MHIAAIMDGNRRWAKTKGWTTLIGHKNGIDVLEAVLEWCPKYNIDVFTIYALSTENLKRSEFELKNLFDLITEFASKTERFQDLNIKVKVMGRKEDLREDSRKALINLEEITKNNTGLLFQICVAYGAHDEMIRAMKKMQEAGDEINEENFEKYLDSALRPDLIIRTGGHQRLSNFLLWQAAYSEFLFLDKFWPEFTEKDLADAVAFLRGEERKFGR